MGLNKHSITNAAPMPIGSTVSLSDTVSDDYSTLVLDHFGQVRSCGESAVSMFHMSHSRLVGMSAADLILGLFEKSAPRGNRAQQLASLARDSGWQQRQMIDAHGQDYAIDLCVSSVVTEGQEVFLAHLHRSAEVDTA